MRTTDIFLLLLVLEASTIQNAVGEYMTTDSTQLELDSTLLELPFEFLCTKEGNFPVPDSCTDFYQCLELSVENVASTPSIITCPLGMIFDSEMQDCLLPSLATSRPECAGKDGTVAPADNCTQDFAEEITEAALDACWIMESVSEYVGLVTSSLPFRPSLSYHKEFNKITPDYNEILAKSQENVKIWRRGNDIFGDIKVIFMKAKQYGNEFNRKYIINQRIRNSQSVLGEDRDAEIIQEIQDDIKILEQDIESVKEILNQTSVPEVKAFFENSINGRLQMIQKKQQQIEATSSIGRELDELTVFLEFVRDDASTIEQKAEALETRLEQFYKDLRSDLDSFENFSIVVNTSMAIVQREKDHLRTQVISQEQVQNLETKNEEEEPSLSYLDDASESKRNEINEQIKVIERKEKEFLDQKAKICPSENIIVSLFSFRFRSMRTLNDCDNLQSHFNTSIRGDLDYLQALNDEYERINQQKIQILSQMKGIEQEHTALEHDFEEHEDQISQLESELKMFEELLHDLNTLRVETNSSLTLISEAVEIHQGVKVIFHDIKSNLNEMITRINSSQNDEERQKAKVIIDSGLYIMKCHVEQFYKEIPELENCS